MINSEQELDLRYSATRRGFTDLDEVGSETGIVGLTDSFVKGLSGEEAVGKLYRRPIQACKMSSIKGVRFALELKAPKFALLYCIRSLNVSSATADLSRSPFPNCIRRRYCS